MADIFLSYAHEDRERLAPLVRAFAESELTVFWDRAIPAGATWRGVLERELRTSACTVVAWSRHSVGSEWVLEEAEASRERLLPVLLDEVVPPMGFRSVQAADLRDWRSPDRLRLVVQAVRARIGADVPAEPVRYRRTYYERFDDPAAVHPDLWPVGMRGEWHGEVVDGVYRLANATTGSTSAFHSTFTYAEGERRLDQSDAKVVMRVRTRPPLGNHAGAGISYRRSHETRTQYAFLLMGGGSVAVLKSDDRRVTFVGAWEVPEWTEDNFVELRVEGEGTRLRFFANDRPVYTLHDDFSPRGDPGFFAMGRGCFEVGGMSVSLPAEPVSGVEDVSDLRRLSGVRAFRPRSGARTRATLRWEGATYGVGPDARRFAGPHMRLHRAEGDDGADLHTFFAAHEPVAGAPDHYVETVLAIRVDAPTRVLVTLEGDRPSIETAPRGTHLVQRAAGALHLYTPDAFHAEFEPVDPDLAEDEDEDEGP